MRYFLFVPAVLLLAVGYLLMQINYGQAGILSLGMGVIVLINAIALQVIMRSASKLINHESQQYEADTDYHVSGHIERR